MDRLVRENLEPNNCRTFSDRSVIEPTTVRLFLTWNRKFELRSFLIEAQVDEIFNLFWFGSFWDCYFENFRPKFKSKDLSPDLSDCWGALVEDVLGLRTNMGLFRGQTCTITMKTDRTVRIVHTSLLSNFEIFILGFPVTNDHSTSWDVHVTPLSSEFVEF